MKQIIIILIIIKLRQTKINGSLKVEINGCISGIYGNVKSVLGQYLRLGLPSPGAGPMVPKKRKLSKKIMLSTQYIKKINQ